MDNRYRGRGYQQDAEHESGDRWNRRSRQNEQFSGAAEDQYGESNWRGEGGDRWSTGEFDRGYASSLRRDELSRGGSGYRGDTSSLDDYDRQGAARWSREETARGYFRPDDLGGQDYGRGIYGASRSGRGDYGARSFGSVGGYGYNAYDRGGARIPPREYDREDRGFFDRASDEVMSWLGDDDAARRRQMDSREDHRGKGPSGYARSSERLLEDANERLMRDSSVDASRITVTCEDNEVTLNGTVTSRSAKRRAEDIVDDISGVKHVQNNLRVETRENYYSETSTLSDS